VPFENVKQTMNRNAWLKMGYIAACVLGLLGYCLPFWSVSVVSLSLNGYDLAEWTTLHPAAQNASPTIYLSFLLRFASVGLIWLLTLGLRLYSNQWLLITFVLVSWIFLLPPFEFFTQSSSDLNYRQQLGIAILTFAGSWAIYLLPKHRLVGTALSVVAVLTLGSLVLGLLGTHALVGNLRFSAVVGVGPMIVAGGNIGAVICFGLVTGQRLSTTAL
jgi:hypothetical protein